MKFEVKGFNMQTLKCVMPEHLTLVILFYHSIDLSILLSVYLSFYISIILSVYHSIILSFLSFCLLSFLSLSVLSVILSFVLSIILSCPFSSECLTTVVFSLVKNWHLCIYLHNEAKQCVFTFHIPSPQIFLLANMIIRCVNRLKINPVLI